MASSVPARRTFYRPRITPIPPGSAGRVREFDVDVLSEVCASIRRYRIPELPILGEPLIPEFANTLYIAGPTRLDVLDHPAWINAWLRQAPCAAELAGPRRVRTEEAERLRVLRDALRGLLTRTSHDNTPDVEAINGAAGSAAGGRLLVVAANGELEVVDSGRARGIDRLLSAIALRVIEAVDCGQFSLNQICGRPGCNLFYFRDHHRRRYCNSRCANADRQARYNKGLDSRLRTRPDIA